MRRGLAEPERNQYFLGTVPTIEINLARDSCCENHEFYSVCGAIRRESRTQAAMIITNHKTRIYSRAPPTLMVMIRRALFCRPPPTRPHPDGDTTINHGPE